MTFLLALAFPIDMFFRLLCTLRLFRAGFPLLVAYRYAVNR